MCFIRAIAFVALLIAPTISHATAQAPDYILIKGKEYALNTNPLQKHLEEIKWQPPKEARISSANWRGYIAKWEIKNGYLLLKNVTILVGVKKQGSDVRKSILRTLFSSKKAITASWYSGALIVPDGKQIQYVHMGYGSTYEHYQILRIELGKVIEHLSMTAEEFTQYKSDKFESFAKTDEFKKVYEEIKKEA